MTDVRIAFWNTWLLSPRAWAGGPRLPDLGAWFGPDVATRAPLVGQALAGRFDVAALSECFETTEQAAVAEAWTGATAVAGPPRRRTKLTGSGLVTLLAPDVELQRSATYSYRSGGDLRDSDTFATKGALFTSVAVHPELPPIEIISTHLFAGGEFLPIPGSDDADRHHVVRMAQVDELVGFIEREHQPQSPLLVVGDFNVQAHNAALDDPTAEYRDLAAHMDRAGLRDVWADHGIGPGHTCTFTDEGQLPPDPDEPDQVVDDADGDAATDAGERIDYLWLTIPDGLDVTVERPRRWAFGGRGVQGGPAGSLSDHLALSVTLRFAT